MQKLELGATQVAEAQGTMFDNCLALSPSLRVRYAEMQHAPSNPSDAGAKPHHQHPPETMHCALVVFVLQSIAILMHARAIYMLYTSRVSPGGVSTMSWRTLLTSGLKACCNPTNTWHLDQRIQLLPRERWWDLTWWRWASDTQQFNEPCF